MLNDFPLADFSLSVVTKRKIDRVMASETSGDDLVDHGRSSHEFTLNGRISLDGYKRLMSLLEIHNIRFSSDLGEYNVVVKEVVFSDKGDLQLKLIEDINPDE